MHTPHTGNEPAPPLQCCHPSPAFLPLHLANKVLRAAQRFAHMCQPMTGLAGQPTHCVVATQCMACCWTPLRGLKHVLSHQPISYHTAQGTSFSPAGHTDRWVSSFARLTQQQGTHFSNYSHRGPKTRSHTHKHRQFASPEYASRINTRAHITTKLPS